MKIFSMPFSNSNKDGKIFFLQENCSLGSLETVGVFGFASLNLVKAKMASKQHVLRERIVRFYETHFQQGKKFTVAHFKEENVPVSTVYRILDSLNVERTVGSGRPVTIMTKQRKTSLKKLFDNKDATSLRDAGRKYGCSHVLIHRTLKMEEIVCRKKTRSPEYTEEPIETVKSQCRWTTKKYRGTSFVLDDESYFPLSKTHIPGNDNYYSSDKSSTPPEVKYKFKHKFVKKVMLYIAISDRGISKPWFKPSGLAINQQIYREECLDKILLPFLNEHHADGKYVFWPDKASSHYAKKTLAYLEEKKIPFVPKDRNPTNLPQCRPIEDFFGSLSALVYKNNWRAKDTKQLTTRIRNCIRKMDVSAVQRSCESIATKLRRTAGHGPYSNIH
ncbi:uncharacterized protein LOC129768048 isoform X1 [Toxorhynchites rutilus septentrionalis]|uniref:uncharacterized protein LOC129768048 isoform X1 n=2 Tax=Toxorhynchites rutilus septentrionalis TaxID=329112 RepID=UPI002478EF27|nr:uncharacterized protein LOC129768048 isoform X1 [Toxorhynchites rutilus septentrionalis]